VFIVNRKEQLFIAFFVNKNLISLQDIKVLGQGPFHATIRIIAKIKGKEKEIVIYNVYNLNKKYKDL